MAVPVAMASGGGAAPAMAVPVAVGGAAGGMLAAAAVPVGGGGGDAAQVQAGRDFLQREGFPGGLAEQVVQTKRAFPLRFWIVDNSGSMGIDDGKLQTPRGPVGCTRWEELRESVNFHGKLAAAMGCQTEFRLLNPPLGGQQIVHVGGGDGGQSLDLLLATMMTDPTGRTPLCAHLKYVHDQIAAQAAVLQGNGQKAVLVIATDGQSTDGDLGQMLRTFERLPVWVVVRLCTDGDEIVEYWNNIDSEIEVDMDVLDDIEGEAKEVVGVNPWLNYGVPLHRAREGGLHKKAFDLLDERLLTQGELMQFIQLLFASDDLPYPEQDWKGFEQQLQRLLQQAGPTYDVLSKKPQPWVSLAKLKRSMGKGGCVVM